jgi:hypothetical protein
MNDSTGMSVVQCKKKLFEEALHQYWRHSLLWKHTAECYKRLAHDWKDEADMTAIKAVVLEVVKKSGYVLVPWMARICIAEVFEYCELISVVDTRGAQRAQYLHGKVLFAVHILNQPDSGVHAMAELSEDLVTAVVGLSDMNRVGNRRVYRLRCLLLALAKRTPC